MRVDSETVTENGITKKLHYLSSATGLFAIFVTTSTGGHQMYHTFKDHQGSLAAVVHGNTVERLSHDPWGRRRNPAGFGYDNVSHTFDRGFTGHEHLSRFGLVNMDGRVYDPVMSCFLSPDLYVPGTADPRSYNRYAYCMYNPLRYVDPSGWLPRRPASGGTPSSADYIREIYAYSERAYEPSDFRNAYYMYNMAFYGNMGGAIGGSGGSYYGSYGYYVAHEASSVYNVIPLLELLRDWQNNPSYSTNIALQKASISYLTCGELYGSYRGDPGYRNSYYSWEDDNGNTHTAEVLFEYVGGNANGVVTKSNQPLWIYAARSILETSKILNQSLGIPMGVISEGIEMAAKSYHNVPLLKANSGLSKVQKIAALSHEGVALMNTTKCLGHVCAVASVCISGYQTINYYVRGGQGSEVLLKGIGDCGMIAVGVFGGPVGLGISIGYFVLDLSTDGFGVSYEIKP